MTREMTSRVYPRLLEWFVGIVVSLLHSLQVLTQLWRLQTGVPPPGAAPSGVFHGL